MAPAGFLSRIFALAGRTDGDKKTSNPTVAVADTGTSSSISAGLASASGQGLSELINAASMLRLQEEQDFNERRLPLDRELMKLLDEIHEVELLLGVSNLITSLATIADEVVRTERLQEELRKLTDEFLTGYKGLVKERTHVIDNGVLVALTKEKREELTEKQRNVVTNIVTDAVREQQQLAICDKQRDRQREYEERLRQRSEDLFTKKDEITMTLECDMSEETRNRIKKIEEQKQLALSSNLLLICELGEFERAQTLLTKLQTTSGLSKANRNEQINRILNERDVNGNTAALLACAAGSGVIVEMLWTHNAAVLDASNHERQTVLHMAARNGNPDLIDWLLRARQNAGVNEQCSNGRTPLHYATFFGHVAATKCLLSNGADVNIVTNPPQSLTPLHNAIQQNRVDVVTYLITREDIDLFKPDGQNLTPFELAAQTESEVMVELLINNVSEDTRLRGLATKCLNSGRRAPRNPAVIQLLQNLAQ